MLLADLGADVIKVEPPKGDFTRYGGPFTKGDTERHYGGYFASVNRSKRSIVLDLQQETDRDTLRELVRDADVIVENFRVGVLDKLGLGYEALAEINPRLVYGAVRGFGDPRTGESPYADWPAFDVVAQAMSGLVATTGDAGHVRHAHRAERRRHLSGHAARARDRVGRPRGAACRGAASSSTSRCTTRSSPCARRPSTAGATGVATTCRTATSTRSTCRSGLFATADGAVALAAPTNHWPILCEVMERPDLIDDERTCDNRARNKNRAMVLEIIEGWLAERTTARGARRARRPGAGRSGEQQRDAVRRSAPSRRGRCSWRSRRRASERPTVYANTPIKFTRTKAGVNRRAPLLDEHGDEVRAEVAAQTESAAQNGSTTE